MRFVTFPFAISGYSIVSSIGLNFFSVDVYFPRSCSIGIVWKCYFDSNFPEISLIREQASDRRNACGIYDDDEHDD